jgi:hypothetical protein
MTTQQKQAIAWKLENYVKSFNSQKQAANSLKDCSEATLIAVLKNNWSTVSEAMWLNLFNQMESSHNKTALVETANLMTLVLYFSIAKEEGATFAITGGAGYGKSAAGKGYANANRGKNAYYLECAGYWNKKMFLSNLLQAMGKVFTGMNIGEMMETIVGELRRKDKPVIILDEIDKLSDPVLNFFITLYNELNGVCGFVWTSTDNIEKRMRKGVNQNKNGYQELYSRIGQKFIVLPRASNEDIAAICLANGITDQEEVARITNESMGDLRRVERNMLKKKAIQMRGKNKKAA